MTGRTVSVYNNKTGGKIKMIDVSKLTPEQKAALLEELKKEEKTKSDIEKEKRDEYKKMVGNIVEESFEKITDVSGLLGWVKKEVIENFQTVLDMKSELYGIKESQQSHSFTSEDGKKTIRIGYRMMDSFDDTVHTGIEKIRNYIYNLVDGENKKQITVILDTLLKKDKNGNLKASKVIELRKQAEIVTDEGFLEGVKIIEEAYKPVKSRMFVEAWHKDEQGNDVNVPLNITAAGEK
jgi:hypothetical protein